MTILDISCYLVFNLCLVLLVRVFILPKERRRQPIGNLDLEWERKLAIWHLSPLKVENVKGLGENLFFLPLLVCSLVISCASFIFELCLLHTLDPDKKFVAVIAHALKVDGALNEFSCVVRWLA